MWVGTIISMEATPIEQANMADASIDCPSPVERPHSPLLMADLPAFDEDAWCAAGEFEARPVPAILKELATARAANVRLLRSLPENCWDRRTAVSRHSATLRALALALVAHALHHARILHERDLPVRAEPDPLEDDEG